MSVQFHAAPRADLDLPDVGALLGLLPMPATEALAWLHRARGAVAWGEAWRFEPSADRARFAQAAEALQAAFADWDGAGPPPRAWASFTFDARGHGSFVRIPAVMVQLTDGAPIVNLAGSEQPLDAAQVALPSAVLPHAATVDRVRYAGSSMPDLLWLDAVAAATRLIDKGALDKVVLTRDLDVWSKAPFDVRVLAWRLAARFADCFTFLAEGLAGASPEMLVRRSGRQVSSLVLAGSAARGVDAADDVVRGDTLLASEKDRAEHGFAVASVREVLAPLCHDLSVDAEPFLLRLDNVQHLATQVSGTLPEPAPTALELAGLLHPTAAVGGTPTAAALDVIRDLEGMDRGRYTGPVGWVDATGDGEFAIALRCAELSGARARLFAGAGIVAASLPEAELEETRLKLRAMQSAFEA